MARTRQKPALYRPVRAGGGAVAQLGERRNRTAEVRGSNPLGSTSQRWVSRSSRRQQNFREHNSCDIGGFEMRLHFLRNVRVFSQLFLLAGLLAATSAGVAL